MKPKKQINWRYWILIGLILAWLIVSIYFYNYFKQECKQSQENPFVYVAKRAGAEICSCLYEDGSSINFNQERAWFVIEKKFNNSLNGFNISLNNSNWGS